MIILGISAFYHDSAAALLIDGRIIAAAQEERFTRKKNDSGFPEKAIAYCLSEAGIELAEVDAVAFYDKPLLKFERLMENYFSQAPKGFFSFLKAMPSWIKEKLFLKDLLRKNLNQIGNFDAKNTPFLFPEHHLSHAASAFYTSPFERAAILTVDGMGEWATATICLGEGSSIRVLKELHYPHSLGLLYSAFTYFLGFEVNSGEYKLMGLAPYGCPDKAREYEAIIREQLAQVYPDGSLWLNPQQFRYTTGLKMVRDRDWERLFGVKKRALNAAIEQEHADLARAIQQFTEACILAMAGHARELTGAEHLCLAGGVALNGVANGKLAAQGLFHELYVQPAAGDAGGALGAALATQHIYFEHGRTPTRPDTMQGALLGPAYSDAFLADFLRTKTARHYPDDHALFDAVAELLASGKVVGWFQGRMEYGPRALGGRSILADPGSAAMQQVLNLKIKGRESFRPFAPMVLEEDAQQYFDLPQNSPYMSLVCPLKAPWRKERASDFSTKSIAEKLALPASHFPAITHVDYSARVQTVSRETHPRSWGLLQKMKEKTGVGMLVNTSMNVNGEPICCSPEDAYQCFEQTQMDALVLGNYVLLKKEPH